MTDSSYQLPVTRCQPRLSRRRSLLATNNWQLATAFTVTELLIVIAIIILAMGLAVPAFNLITANKSTEAAQNQISAMLGRARTEAIGLQEIRGLMFYFDPVEERVNVVVVTAADRGTSNTLDVDVYLDLAVDDKGVPVDGLTLPKGVALQTIDDSGPVLTPNDRYIGFNQVNGNSNTLKTDVPYGGVILFDSNGLLVSKRYAFETHIDDPTSSAANPPQIYTQMGMLLYRNSIQSSPAVPLSTQVDVVPVNTGIVGQVTPPITAQYAIRSQLGFALFDYEIFKNQGFGLEDLQVISPTAAYNGSSEQTEENWLDANAVPLFINRYNGTLVKGE